MLVLVFFPVCALFAMAVWNCGDAMAEGTEPPAEGDWVLRGSTVIHSADITAPGNIIIEEGATVHIVNTTLRVNRTEAGQHTLVVEDGALLHVYGGSSLELDRFVAGPESTVNLLDCIIRTTGEMLIHSHDLVAENVTIWNTAPDSGPDEPGRYAILVLNGSEDSEFTRVTIHNHGGDAGLTSPGVNGSRGGDSKMVSNVSIWRECTIDVRAGRSGSGGLALTSVTGGSGGEGADAILVLCCVLFEDTTIEVTAGDGGIGARGSNNPSGNAADGGDGASGGNATVSIESTNTLEMDTCAIVTISGDGGSGANGGTAIDGNAGDGGEGANGGDAILEITSKLDMDIARCDLQAIAGEGGYGGDYGRHDGGVGDFGIPRPGGDGGPASIEVLGQVNLIVENLRAHARGGDGLDGGGGYDQGETGGRGGDALVRFRVEAAIESVAVDLNAIGGVGGLGGPSFSEIRGNGGDGGDALVEFTGLLEMDMEEFSIYVNYGTGGIGNKVIYNGADGIPTLDLDTEDLYGAEGIFNMPLDDLHGDAVGELFNVTFDMEFGIRVLPIGNAVVETIYPVTVHVGTLPGAAWDEVEGLIVTVISIISGELIGTNTTDADGRCGFDLPASRYTSQEVTYLGYYYFIISTPDGKTTKTVWGDVIGPTDIRAVMSIPPPTPYILIDSPDSRTDLLVFTGMDTHVMTHGRILYDGDGIGSVSVRLYSYPGDQYDWPTYDLTSRGTVVPLDKEPEELSGNFYGPFDGRNWTFYQLVQVFDEDKDRFMYETGRLVLQVSVTTEYGTYYETQGVEIIIDRNHGKPTLMVLTPLLELVFNGTTKTIVGLALDDYQTLLVEVRLDDGEWFEAEGTHNWNAAVTMDHLAEGVHTIEFRSWDGLQHSDVVSYDFTIEWDGPGVQDEDTPQEGWWTPLALAIVAIAIATTTLTIGLFVLSRRPPDS